MSYLFFFSVFTRFVSHLFRSGNTLLFARVEHQTLTFALTLICFDCIISMVIKLCWSVECERIEAPAFPLFSSFETKERVRGEKYSMITLSFPSLYIVQCDEMNYQIVVVTPISSATSSVVRHGHDTSLNIREETKIIKAHLL